METVVVVCLSLGIVTLLLQQRALRRRLDGLPVTVWSLASKHAEARDRQEVAALAEATETKARRLVLRIQEYHDQIAADFRAQVAEGKAQLRANEQRASDAGVALDAACTLVTRARELTERLEVIASQPVVDPSLRAASLTPRPVEVRAEVPTKRPPPPHAPPRKATLLGIRPPPLPRAIEEEEGERASDEVTRVADRPKALAKTLVSMQAVTTPEKKEGGS